MGVEMLYGRFPTTRSLGTPSLRAKSVKSTRNTSDSITSSPGLMRSFAAKSRSNSITLSLSKHANNGLVSAAKPGPISTMGSLRWGLIPSTIDVMIRPSFKKCCPNRLRAMCFIGWSAACEYRHRHGRVHHAPTRHNAAPLAAHVTSW